MQKRCDITEAFFSRWMEHPGQTPDSELNGHLLHCPTCRLFVAFLLSDLPSAAVSERLLKKIRDTIEADLRVDSANPVSPNRLLCFAVALAVGTFTSWFAFWVLSRENSPLRAEPGYAMAMLLAALVLWIINFSVEFCASPGKRIHGFAIGAALAVPLVFYSRTVALSHGSLEWAQGLFCATALACLSMVGVLPLILLLRKQVSRQSKLTFTAMASVAAIMPFLAVDTVCPSSSLEHHVVWHWSFWLVLTIVGGVIPSFRLRPQEV